MSGLIQCAKEYVRRHDYKRSNALAKYALRNIRVCQNVFLTLRDLYEIVDNIGRQNLASLQFVDVFDILRSLVEQIADIISSFADSA